jgi:hypothetical protein
MQRAYHLQAISQLVVNGQTISKLDFIATISIHGYPYFNVFRRYNNVYEIAIEDFQGDFHFHRDHTMKASIQSILCLTDEQMKYFTVSQAVCFKKHASIHLSGNERWSELQAVYQGATINVEGILMDHPHYAAPYEFQDVPVPQLGLHSVGVQSSGVHSVGVQSSGVQSSGVRPILCDSCIGQKRKYHEVDEDIDFEHHDQSDETEEMEETESLDQEEDQEDQEESEESEELEPIVLRSRVIRRN